MVPDYQPKPLEHRKRRWLVRPVLVASLLLVAMSAKYSTRAWSKARLLWAQHRLATQRFSDRVAHQEDLAGAPKTDAAKKQYDRQLVPAIVFQSSEWEAFQKEAGLRYPDACFAGVLKARGGAPRIVAVYTSGASYGPKGPSLRMYAADVIEPATLTKPMRTVGEGPVGALVVLEAPLTLSEARVDASNPARAVVNYRSAVDGDTGSIEIELQSDDSISWRVLGGRSAEESNSETRRYREANDVDHPEVPEALWLLQEKVRTTQGDANL